jgi:hypothetical protein
MRFSNSDFFHDSVSSGPLNIPFWPFRIFKKICGDIRNFLNIAGVFVAGDKI